MVYVGSKSRITKEIVPLIQNVIDIKNIKIYVEPFVGGANVIDKIQAYRKIGTDSNKYLIALLNYVKKNQSLPDVVLDKEHCYYVKNNKDEFEDWYVGFIGFVPMGFNGMFYASYIGDSRRGNAGNLKQQETINNLLRQAPKLVGTSFYHKSYQEMITELKTVDNILFYCDPPYANTRNHYKQGKFDTEMFWNDIRELSKTKYVIVSELNAPDDFVCVWQKEIKRGFKGDFKTVTKAIEKLFIYKGGLLNEDDF